MELKTVMKITFSFAGLLAASFQSAALAAPIYLECTEFNETSSATFSVTVDEATGNITHTNEYGDSFNAKGVFTANSIKYQEVGSFGKATMHVTYEINRTDLSLTDTFFAESTDPALAEDVAALKGVLHGMCSIVSTEGRKN